MLVHWIWLATRPSVSDRMKAVLMQHFRDPEDIFYAEEDAFSHIEGMTKAMADALADKDLRPAQKILDTCTRQKLHILTFRDANYPARLRHISDPPLVLYYKGSLPDFDGTPMIGLVGTRKASAYGLQAAKQMGYQIAKCGGIVVSGMANGIDASAMSGALSAGSAVVGVLGCGADVVYPKSNRWLFADTERFGCILSEFPPETEPFGWNFPKRNRIISGMCNGVLVVEAPQISGALSTANHALEQGRDVFVVPGNMDNPGFAGSFKLIRDGGTMVTSGWEVMSEYAAQYPGKVRMDTSGTKLRAYPDEVQLAAQDAEKVPPKVAQKAHVPETKPNKKEKSYKKVVDNAAQGAYSDVNKALPELTPDQQSIVTALEGGERQVDDVIAEVNLPAHKVMSALTMLVIKGVVKKLPGNRIVMKK